MPTRTELIASARNVAEIRNAIGADALVFQELDDLKRAVRDCNPSLRSFEASCFDGVYVTGDVSPAYLDRVERARLQPATMEGSGLSQLSLAIENSEN
jgi:amidophosphoribosyltransferase